MPNVAAGRCVGVAILVVVVDFSFEVFVMCQRLQQALAASPKWESLGCNPCNFRHFQGGGRKRTGEGGVKRKGEREMNGGREGGGRKTGEGE